MRIAEQKNQNAAFLGKKVKFLKKSMHVRHCSPMVCYKK
jgi:hypothetical protein